MLRVAEDVGGQGRREGRFVGERDGRGVAEGLLRAGPAADEILMRLSDFVLVLPAMYVVLSLRAAMPAAASSPRRPPPITTAFAPGRLAAIIALVSSRSR